MQKNLGQVHLAQGLGTATRNPAKDIVVFNDTRHETETNIESLSNIGNRMCPDHILMQKNVDYDLLTVSPSMTFVICSLSTSI